MVFFKTDLQNCDATQREQGIPSIIYSEYTKATYFFLAFQTQSPTNTY